MEKQKRNKIKKKEKGVWWDSPHTHTHTHTHKQSHTPLEFIAKIEKKKKRKMHKGCGVLCVSI